MPLQFCAGFVGADLTALCKEAAAIAVTRIFDTLGAAEASAAAALAASTEGADGVDAMQVDGAVVAVPPQEPRCAARAHRRPPGEGVTHLPPLARHSRAMLEV